MDKKFYTVHLVSNNKELTIENLTLNGNNYVSETEIDFSNFPKIFSLTAIDEDANVIERMPHAKLLQQVKYDWDEGYYLAFTEISQYELDQSIQNAKIEYIAMMSDIDMEGL